MGVYATGSKGGQKPRLPYPPIRIYRFQGKAYSEGVETHGVDGIPVRIYSVEKTLADCFKFRNQIGQGVAIEALRMAWKARILDLGKLMHFMRICRVEKAMRPYLEAMI